MEEKLQFAPIGNNMVREEKKRVCSEAEGTGPYPIYRGVRRRGWGKWVFEIHEPRKKEEDLARLLRYSTDGSSSPRRSFSMLERQGRFPQLSRFSERVSSPVLVGSV